MFIQKIMQAQAEDEKEFTAFKSNLSLFEVHKYYQQLHGECGNDETWIRLGEMPKGELEQLVRSKFDAERGMRRTTMQVIVGRDNVLGVLDEWKMEARNQERNKVKL